MIFLKKSHRVVIVAILLFIIAFFDYATMLHLSSIDLIYRELYIVPVLLGAYWFGKKGGIVTALAASAVYLPCAMLASPVGSATFFSNLLEIGVFNAVGYFVGTYYDLRKAQFTLTSPDYDNELPQQTKNILFCIVSAENTVKAAHYLADNYSSQNNLTVTMIGFLGIQPQDLFATKQEYSAASEKSKSDMTHLLNRAKAIMLQRGISETNIRERTMTIEQGAVANTILAEQRRGHYNMIVTGGSKIPKAKEFLFGNTNVTLVREAPCPLLIVC